MNSLPDLTCFLDCDGVISDFIGGCSKLLNKTYEECFNGRDRPLPWNLSDLYPGIDEKEFMSRMDIRFWAELPVYPWAHELVELLEKIFNGRLILCTSAGYLGDEIHYFTNAVQGKEKWIMKHFPQFAKKTVFCYNKEYLASPYHVLIDDNELNIKAFTDNGGIGILFPQDWNGLYRHVKNPIKYIRDILETF